MRPFFLLSASVILLAGCGGRSPLTMGELEVSVLDTAGVEYPIPVEDIGGVEVSVPVESTTGHTATATVRVLPGQDRLEVCVDTALLFKERCFNVWAFVQMLAGSN